MQVGDLVRLDCDDMWIGVVMKVDYDWFKFVHNKNDVNGLPPVYKNNEFLQTYKQEDALYLGGHRQSRIWHYHEKDTMEKLDARIF